MFKLEKLLRLERNKRNTAELGLVLGWVSLDILTQGFCLIYACKGIFKGLNFLSILNPIS